MNDNTKKLLNKNKGCTLEKNRSLPNFFNNCFFASICTMWNFRLKSLQQFNLVKHSINYILDHQNLLVFSTSFHRGTFNVCLLSY